MLIWNFIYWTECRSKEVTFFMRDAENGRWMRVIPKVLTFSKSSYDTTFCLYSLRFHSHQCSPKSDHDFHKNYYAWQDNGPSWWLDEDKTACLIVGCSNNHCFDHCRLILGKKAFGFFIQAVPWSRCQEFWMSSHINGCCRHTNGNTEFGLIKTDKVG